MNNQTRTKQIIAAVGAVLVVVAPAISPAEYEPIVQGVLALLTVLGVGKVPNRPKA